MKRIGLVATLLGVLALILGACGSNSNKSGGSTSSSGASSTAVASAGPCDIGSGTNGNGASLKIGSKPFAEEQLLATMTKLVLEKNGFKVDFTTQAADPAIDQALRSGQIDMLWQYTGTELQNFLNVDQPPTDLDQAFAMAQQKDAAASPALCWVAPAPLNDTNGLAIKASDASKYGTTLTQFGQYLQANPNTAVCIMSEFRTRADGLPGLQKAYDSGYVGAKNYKDIGSTAEAPINSGDCAAGEVFTTDSAIAQYNLQVLQDDKKLFPPDNVGLIVRSETLKKNPAIANLMKPVAAKLTSDQITKLNKSVEVDKQNVNDVAKAWLQQNGFL
jgi:osmoprotectant transport system substrate-binding protein